jgi:glycosyltransferase involved in cell wall biosynthesis
MSESSRKLSVWVVGSENPRIRDFFNQVGRWAKISYLDIEPIGRTPSLAQIADSWRWRRRGKGFPEARICLPVRWTNLSNSLSNWFCRRRFAQTGRPDVVVFTWPRLAPLCEKLPDVFRVYYCKDPFDRWPGAPAATRELQQRLLNNCDAVFPVARQLVEDFAPSARGKVVYLPNAVDDAFVDAPPQPRPADLPTGKPIAGCVGQINHTYDWQYIRQLAAGLPEVTFCFVGPLVPRNRYDRRDILTQLRTTPNIVWLGGRPHAQLPAYIQHFDICFNCLIADENSHRRSPLRLYDYLATDRPIVSTPVREAYETLPHVYIAPTPDEAVQTVRKILNGELTVDLPARHDFIKQNTWSARAAQFMGHLHEFGLKP